ncbi:MAG: succinate dehydrogenase/fumarate reductase flavoprotein subunit, partial [Deltaproteobacteria bacterium]|nr:succinate dehydrogenase/fumarate reductase flavoprotein subunit [Deltaproteobacteria bacterium]
MPYPPEMQGSLKKVEASRSANAEKSFPKLDFVEKTALLEAYHPDFINSAKKEIRIGPNKG